SSRSCAEAGAWMGAAPSGLRAPPSRPPNSSRCSPMPWPSPATSEPGRSRPSTSQVRAAPPWSVTPPATPRRGRPTSRTSSPRGVGSGLRCMTPVAPPPDPAGRRAGPSDSPHGRLLVPATLGIRHFSPASARALSLLLEALQPDCILLEAPVDAAGRLRDLGATGTRPPVGLVGVPSPLDGDRFLYPLAPESPEWVAVRWAHERGCLLEGIDLPGAALLALERTTASQSPHDAPV